MNALRTKFRTKIQLTKKLRTRSRTKWDLLKSSYQLAWPGIVLGAFRFLSDVPRNGRTVGDGPHREWWGRSHSGHPCSDSRCSLDRRLGRTRRNSVLWLLGSICLLPSRTRVQAAWRVHRFWKCPGIFVEPWWRSSFTIRMDTNELNHRNSVNTRTRNARWWAVERWKSSVESGTLKLFILFIEGKRLIIINRLKSHTTVSAVPSHCYH